MNFKSGININYTLNNNNNVEVNLLYTQKYGLVFRFAFFSHYFKFPALHPRFYLK